MTRPLPCFVGGASRLFDGVGVLDHWNPSDSGDLVTRVAVAGAEEVLAAVSSAWDARHVWGDLSGPARSAILHRWGEIIAARAEEFARLMVREIGKPLGEARGEAARATVICRYYAGEAVRDIGEIIPAQNADAFQFTLRRPLGPAALITPWNFPLAIPLWKAAPALAFGNPVVLKPSPQASATALLLAETSLQAGIPAGAFNVITGDGSTGEILLNDPRVRLLSFTGSQQAGRRVAALAAARQLPVQAEMGGKNVVIVAEDADLDRAAVLTASGAMRYAGQKCTATARVIVDRRVEAAFLERLRQAVSTLSLALPDHPEAAVGPVITQAARERIMGMLQQHPAEPIYQSTVPVDEAHRPGNWVAPTLLRLPDGQHPLAQQEIFGPVLGVLQAEDLDHALFLANQTPYGLSASLFTANLPAAMKYVRQIEAGLVRINGDTTGVDPHAPFGGMKGSGYGGREQGRAARDFYTELQTVQVHG